MNNCNNDEKQVTGVSESME